MAERYNFKYLPLVGKLPGKSMVEQTETAINELASVVYDNVGYVGNLAEEVQTANTNASNALDKATEALETSGRVYINQIAAVDVNDYYDSELYYINNDGSTNIPVRDRGFLEVKTNDDKTACEQVFIADSTGTPYYRHGRITEQTLGEETTYVVTWSSWHRVATTEYVQAELQDYLPLSGGTLTGVVNGVTPTAGDNSTKIATTEFVNVKAGNYLPLSGGTLTGVVNGVTPTAGDNSTKIATTEFVNVKAGNYLPLSGGTLTGVVNGVTPTAGDNSTKIATTEFVNVKAGNYLPLSGGTVTGGLTVEGTITGNLAGYVKIQNNAGFHNSIFRGKNLGTSLTAAQSAAIQAGTFDDMYIGDYWTINGINWRIGMFDPWYNVGDTNFATHHLGIIPDTILYNAQYNTSNTTEGGYVGSALYAGIGTARTTVKNAFGAAHVPTHRILLPDTCTGGKYTSWAWRDEDIMLMTEVMVYGARAWGAPGNNGYSVASQDCQWPLFALSPQHRHPRQSYWLQDVASASWFARVSGYGFADRYDASNSLGVRPAFALI